MNIEAKLWFLFIIVCKNKVNTVYGNLWLRSLCPLFFSYLLLSDRQRYPAYYSILATWQAANSLRFRRVHLLARYPTLIPWMFHGFESELCED